MNKITVTGLIVVASPEATKNGGYFLRCKKNISEKKGGEWSTVAMWPTLFLNDSQYETVTKMGVKPGSTIAVGGNYTVAPYTATDGKSYINFTIVPDYIEYSTGNSDSGLFSVTHTNCGIVSELTKVNENFSYADVLFDEGWGDNKKTQRMRVCISGNVPACVEKGKRVDVIGRLSLSLNQGKDGKVYLNRSCYAKEVVKTPFFPKKPEENAGGNTASAAIPTAAPQGPTNAQAQFDLSEFEEVESNAQFF
jgi:hypothetical protein